MRVKPHHHLCQNCGVTVDCAGARVENHDGFPAVICPLFHLPTGEINADFLCDWCATDDGESVKQQNADTLSRHLNETLMQNTVPAIRL